MTNDLKTFLNFFLTSELLQMQVCYDEAEPSRNNTAFAKANCQKEIQKSFQIMSLEHDLSLVPK